MATVTKRFSANTSWQQATAGPATIVLNIENGFVDMAIATTTPTDGSKSFLLKPVAGENYIEFELASGDKLYFKSRRELSVLSWIEKPTS